jgi:hypothetical protein
MVLYASTFWSVEFHLAFYWSRQSGLADSRPGPIYDASGDRP